MANTTIWQVNAAYAAAGFTLTGFNSLANGSTVLATSAQTNSTNLYLYGDVSFVLTVGGTTTGTSYMSLYLLPLNQDGSTYGDNSASGATAPSSGYNVGNIGVLSGVTSGNTIVGTFRGVVLPPSNFKWLVQNNLGVALNATAAATVDALYYGENLNF